MASYPELQNLASYVYDSVLGTTKEDSGSGAPANVAGWIRTGEGGGFGPDNCSDWTLGDALSSGPIMRINPMASQSQGFAFYEYVDFSCVSDFPVWCVEDGSPG